MNKNYKYAKTLLLHLSKHADRYWTPKSIKQKLQIDLGLYWGGENQVILSQKLILFLFR